MPVLPCGDGKSVDSGSQALRCEVVGRTGFYSSSSLIHVVFLLPFSTWVCGDPKLPHGCLVACVINLWSV